jgi:hypothetical protein
MFKFYLMFKYPLFNFSRYNCEYIKKKGPIMDVNKIRKICRPVRVVVGLALIGAAVVTGINWLYLGVIPLIAGITNFCPLCTITGKCDLPQK